jgi:hypothetical protein
MDIDGLLFFKVMELHPYDHMMKQFALRQLILIDIDTSIALYIVNR